MINVYSPEYSPQLPFKLHLSCARMLLKSGEVEICETILALNFLVSVKRLTVGGWEHPWNQDQLLYQNYRQSDSVDQSGSHLHKRIDSQFNFPKFPWLCHIPHRSYGGLWLGDLKGQQWKSIYGKRHLSAPR